MRGPTRGESMFKRRLIFGDTPIALGPVVLLDPSSVQAEAEQKRQSTSESETNGTLDHRTDQTDLGETLMTPQRWVQVAREASVALSALPPEAIGMRWRVEEQPSNQMTTVGVLL